MGAGYLTMHHSGKLTLLFFALGFLCVTVAVSEDKPITLALVGYTGSMKPALKGGETLAVVQTPFDQLKVGDVVLRRVPWSDIPILHRVIHRRSSDRLVTKGDANRDADAWWLTPSDYLGRAIMPCTH